MMAADSPNNRRRIEEVTDLMMIQAQIQKRHIIVNRSSADFEMSPLSKSMKKSLGYWSQSLHLGSSSPDLRVDGDVAGSASDIKDCRDREKKELQDLNERLANYIESNRFFKIQNRKLADELKKLKTKAEEPSRIRDFCEAEVAEARRLLDEAIREKGHLEVDKATLEEALLDARQRLAFALKDAEDAKEKFEKQNQQLSDLEGEVGLLRRRLGSLETERDKERALNKKLQEALNAARKDLNSETLLHIDAESKQQSLEEELRFLKTIHEQELRELKKSICRDSTHENHVYWKSEIGQALRDIQEIFDERLNAIRAEEQKFFNVKLELIQANALKNNMPWARLKEDNERLRKEVEILQDKLGDPDSKYAQLQHKFHLLMREKEESERDLEQRNDDLMKQVARHKAEIEAMIKEIKIILDTKHGLELEIITYRRLLELEEGRQQLPELTDNSSTGFGHGQIGNSFVSEDESREYTIRHMESTSGDPENVLHLIRGELIAKAVSQKSAKGPIAFDECPQDGKYIALVNTGRKDEDLDNWSLTRDIDGKNSVTYKFTESIVLRPQQKIKVWSKGTKPFSGATDDIESDLDWGVGLVIDTKLINPAGEERATHKQRTSGEGHLVRGAK